MFKNQPRNHNFLYRSGISGCVWGRFSSVDILLRRRFHRFISTVVGNIVLGVSGELIEDIIVLGVSGELIEDIIVLEVSGELIVY